MGDLEQVDARQPGGQQSWVDTVLDVAGEQEAPLPDDPEQHDRDVVDARSVVGRIARHLAPDGPQHAQVHPIHAQPVAGGQPGARRSLIARQAVVPRRVSRPRTEHPGLEDAPDPVPIEQQGEPRHVVLVGMRQHDRIKASIPWRDAPVELDEQAVGVRATVDEQPSAAAALDQDGVATR